MGDGIFCFRISRWSSADSPSWPTLMMNLSVTGEFSRRTSKQVHTEHSLWFVGNGNISSAVVDKGYTFNGRGDFF